MWITLLKLSLFKLFMKFRCLNGCGLNKEKTKLILNVEVGRFLYCARALKGLELVILLTKEDDGCS